MEIIRFKKNKRIRGKFQNLKNVTGLSFNLKSYSKKIPNMVYFSGKELVATDGYRLHIMKYNEELKCLKKNTLYEILKNTAKEIVLHGAESQEYVDYKQIIPKEDLLTNFGLFPLGSKDSAKNSAELLNIFSLTKKIINFEYVKDLMDDSYSVFGNEKEPNSPIVFDSPEMKYLLMPVIIP